MIILHSQQNYQQGDIMEKTQQYLFIISGPAGVGKDSVVQAMRDKHTDIERSVTATTRAPRPGEVEGVNYYYLTLEAFEKLRDNGGILEWNCYCGNYYGTMRSDVDKRLAQKKAVVLVIDVNGAMRIKKMYPNAHTIFILPPSNTELEKRLRGRGTETEDVIAERLEIAKQELAVGDSYDENVVNDDINTAAERLYQIIQENLPK